VKFDVKKYIKNEEHFTRRDKKIKYFLFNKLRRNITEKVPIILPICTIDPYIPKD
jgi:hypothetical protein